MSTREPPAAAPPADIIDVATGTDEDDGAMEAPTGNPSFASALEHAEDDEHEEDDTTTPTTTNHTTTTPHNTNHHQRRQGTIRSARFNILCTMVGGGCLSLPMAFQKTGNALGGPLCLLVTAGVTEYCFRIILVACTRSSTSTSTRRTSTTTTQIGHDSFEDMARTAFGRQGYRGAKHLVTAMCFFGAVGYAVLLRDMLEPIADAMTQYITEKKGHHHGDGGNHTIVPPDDHNHTIVPGSNGTDPNGTTTTAVVLYSMMESTVRQMLQEDTTEDDDDADYYLQENESSTTTTTGGGGGGPTWMSNAVMLLVILGITPVCTLSNLSRLEPLGAASMSSILILGACIVVRSLQCNSSMGSGGGGHHHDDNHHWMMMMMEDDDAPGWPAFSFFPQSWKDVLGTKLIYDV